MQALGVTTSTRANVQSVAAAESGINVAVASVQTTGCPSGGTFTSAGTPAYTVQMAWSTTDPANWTTAAWTSGCPSVGAQLIRFLSTGTAAAKGVNGYSTGNVAKIESIYTTTYSAPGIAATGAALYAFSSGGFTGSGGLTSGVGSVPSVQVRHGDVNCNGDSPTYADIVVADGTFNASGSCTVNGFVFASKDVNLSGGITIGSSIVGTKVNMGGGRVGGSVWGSTQVTSSWGNIVEGGVTSPKVILAGGNVKGESWSSGETNGSGGGLVIDGHITTKTLTGTTITAKGGKTVVPAGPGAGPGRPASPFVPDWIEFKYNQADWPGFALRTLSGACDYTVLQNAADQMASTPGVIDARLCSGASISISDYQKLNLSNDLVIIAKSFALGGSTGFTSSVPRKLWLITSDDDPTNHEPSCVTNGFSVGGTVSFSTGITALVYTPCNVSIGSGIRWPGQVFGKTTAIDGNARLVYYPMGLPGVDLATGVVTPSVPATSSIVLISQIDMRDVN
ncbi:MAG: hypothetical protein ABWX92_10165, partial [Mycetocola sp.]